MGHMRDTDSIHVFLTIPRVKRANAKPSVTFAV